MEQVCSRISALLAEAEAAIAEGKFSGVALAVPPPRKMTAASLPKPLPVRSTCPPRAAACEALAGCLAYTSAEDISLSLYLPISAERMRTFPKCWPAMLPTGWITRPSCPPT